MQMVVGVEGTDWPIPDALLRACKLTRLKKGTKYLTRMAQLLIGWKRRLAKVDICHKLAAHTPPYWWTLTGSLCFWHFWDLWCPFSLPYFSNSRSSSDPFSFLPLSKHWCFQHTCTCEFINFLTLILSGYLKSYFPSKVRNQMRTLKAVCWGAWVA